MKCVDYYFDFLKESCTFCNSIERLKFYILTLNVDIIIRFFRWFTWELFLHTFWIYEICLVTIRPWFLSLTVVIGGTSVRVHIQEGDRSPLSIKLHIVVFIVFVLYLYFMSKWMNMWYKYTASNLVNSCWL